MKQTLALIFLFIFSACGEYKVKLPEATSGSQNSFPLPALSSVSISSSNSNQQYAKIGDTITVMFSSTVPLTSHDVLILGQSASVFHIGGNHYQANYTITGTEPEGEASFQINFADAYQTGNSISDVTDFTNVTIKTSVDAPDRVGLKSPLTSPDVESSPEFHISGVEDGALVELFSDACVTLVDSGTVSGTTIDLRSTALSAGTYTFYARQTDSLGNVSACSTSSLTYEKIDPTPTLTAVSIASDNANPLYATTGDVITLSFSASSVLDSHTVTIQGQTATVTHTGGSNYEATYTVSGAEAQGLVSFNIAFAASGTNGTPVTAVTDLSSVIVKTTVAAPSSITLKSPAVSPNTVTTPEFTIGGLETGATVRLYRDACTTLAASGTATGASLDLTSNTLTNGTYQFYAKQIDTLGNESACSTASAAYRKINQPFISTWRTTAPNEVITLPLRSGFTYNMTVDWGDGTPVQDITSWNDTDKAHTYASAGDYTVTLAGIAESWYFNDTGSKLKIISIQNFGDMGWKALDSAFRGATQLTAMAGGNVSQVTNMRDMFRTATQVEPDTSGWDTSSVTDMSYMFNGASKARPNTTNWNTSQVTTMAYMFASATLATPDTSNWDTGNVTTMDSMFHSAKNCNPDVSNWEMTGVRNINLMFHQTDLANPDVSQWDTQNIENMAGVFRTAKAAAPDTSNWNTTNVTDMNYMFSAATLANPDVSNWDTSKVTNMSNMFASTPVANPNTSDWDTSNVTDMSGMFKQTTIANPDTSGWGTAKVTNMSDMFRSAAQATPNTSNWNTTLVTNMSGMFAFAAKANPDVSQWDTANVTNMASLFQATPLATPNTTNWNTAKVTAMNSMFSGAAKATPDTSNWDTSQVTTFQSMFASASLATPDTSNWDTAKATTFRGMFIGTKFAVPNTTNWDTAKVTDMASMFSGAEIAAPDTSNWDTTNVTDMSYMFQETLNANPDTSNWNTLKVTDMTGMFRRAKGATPDTANWAVDNVTKMASMFFEANLAAPDTTNWNTPKVTTMNAMFQGALSANPDMSKWSFGAVTDFTNMFNGATISNGNYSTLLILIEAQSPQNNRALHGGSSHYDPAAATARQNLVNRGWTITDGGP